MKRISLIILFLFPLISFAAIYKWVDEDGGVHFSDEHHKGAEKISSEDVPTYEALPIPKLKPISDEKMKASEPYYSLYIVEPKRDTTVRNNMGYVNIDFEVKPGLYPGDTLLVLLDGKVIQKRRYEANISLLNVERGTHTIELQIIGKDKKLKIRTRPVRFHMRKAYRNHRGPWHKHSHDRIHRGDREHMGDKDHSHRYRHRD